MRRRSLIYNKIRPESWSREIYGFGESPGPEKCNIVDETGDKSMHQDVSSLGSRMHNGHSDSYIS
jgi:hypothetical protein